MLKFRISDPDHWTMGQSAVWRWFNGCHVFFLIKKKNLLFSSYSFLSWFFFVNFLLLYFLYYFPAIFLYSFSSLCFYWDRYFHRIGPLGRFDLVVAMSVCCCCVLSPFHEEDFESYFAPTSRSRMSNIFRDSVSLAKSAGKKWS